MLLCRLLPPLDRLLAGRKGYHCRGDRVGLAPSYPSDLADHAASGSHLSRAFLGATALGLDGLHDRYDAVGHLGHFRLRRRMDVVDTKLLLPQFAAHAVNAPDGDEHRDDLVGARLHAAARTPRDALERIPAL